MTKTTGVLKIHRLALSTLSALSLQIAASSSLAAPIAQNQCQLQFMDPAVVAAARAENAAGSQMRLPPNAPETRRFHRMRLVWEKMIGRQPFDGSSDARMTALMAHREFKEWFYFKNETLGGLEINNPAALGLSKMVQTPQEGFLAKIMAIRQAKHTVDVTYYIFTKDQVGMAMLEEIKRAIRRGVNVRYMEDGVGTPSVSRAEAKALIEYAEKNAGFVLNEKGEPTNIRAKFEFVAFNPVSSIVVDALGNLGRYVLNMSGAIAGDPERVPYNEININRRSHDKILLVDGAFPERSIAIMGGRNISTHYYGIPHVDEHTYRDSEWVFRNLPDTSLISDRTQDIGAVIGDYFHRVYSHLGNRQISRGLMGLLFGYEKYLQQMRSGWRWANKHTKEEQARLEEDMKSPDFGQRYFDNDFATGPIDVVHTLHNLVRERAMRDYERNDMQSKVKNRNGIIAHFRELAKTEDKEIVIVSPYIWFSPGQILLLKKWLLQDPNRKLTIITNSVLTSDNMLAQAMVDQVMAPALAMDEGLFDKNGKQIRRSIAAQVKIYEYGKLDSNELGGTVPYGKLHSKLALLVGRGITLGTTFNGDPRSQFLNSEGGAFITSAKLAGATAKEIQDLINGSHLWGSDEFHAIRTHQMLPEKKRFLVQKQRELNWLIYKLHLWWLI